MRVVQSISLDTELDEDVLLYLKSAPNKSQFIKDCIRSKMAEKDSFTERQIKQIREIVQSMVTVEDSKEQQMLASALNDCLDSFMAN